MMKDGKSGYDDCQRLDSALSYPASPVYVGVVLRCAALCCVPAIATTTHYQAITIKYHRFIQTLSCICLFSQ
jgi:hypothetical protein